MKLIMVRDRAATEIINLWFMATNCPPGSTCVTLHPTAAHKSALFSQTGVWFTWAKVFFLHNDIKFIFEMRTCHCNFFWNLTWLIYFLQLWTKPHICIHLSHCCHTFNNHKTRRTFFFSQHEKGNSKSFGRGYQNGSLSFHFPGICFQKWRNVTASPQGLDWTSDLAAPFTLSPIPERQFVCKLAALSVGWYCEAFVCISHLHLLSFLRIAKLRIQLAPKVIFSLRKNLKKFLSFAQGFGLSVFVFHFFFFVLFRKKMKSPCSTRFTKRPWLTPCFLY